LGLGGLLLFGTAAGGVFENIGGSTSLANSSFIIAKEAIATEP